MKTSGRAITANGRTAACFLVDATFLLDDNEKAFLGAPLLVDARGRDSTVLYGVIRDLLRLRQHLGIVAGVVVVGSEAVRIASKENLALVLECLPRLGTVVVHEPQVAVGSICKSLSTSARWLVTRDRAMLQLVSGTLGAVLIREGEPRAPEITTEDTLDSNLGLRPKQVPAFLALTEGGKERLFNKQQGTRLLQVHGDLGSLLADTSGVGSASVKRRLTENREALRARLAALTIMAWANGASKSGFVNELVADTEETRTVLREYGLPSLVRLVSAPEPVRIEAPSAKRGPKYAAVRDEAGLRQLRDAISNCDVCAIDTESSDKDPRRATLFGVAFAVGEGRAFYVPVTEADLRGTTPKDVLRVLRQLLATDLKAVGHNLKYDYVLLRRHGIEMKNPYFDTMLAAYDCFGDLPFFNLSALSRRFLGRDIKRYRDIVDEGKTLLDVPFNDLVEHGCSDADTTLRLHRYLRQALAERRIEDAFMTVTMPLMRLLGDTEVDGLRIDVRALMRQQSALERQTAALRRLIDGQGGKGADLESVKGVAAFVMSLNGLRDHIGRRSVTLAQLEQIAQGHELIRNILRYLRLRRRAKQLDSIQEAVTGGTVSPLFSQVRLAHGGFSSTEPKLFDSDGMFESDFIKDATIRHRLPHRMRALDMLQTVTGDRVLKADRKAGRTAFAPIDTEVGTDHGDLLLSTAIDLSTAALCRRFLLKPRTILSLRETLRSHYVTLFGWLDEYRRQAQADGFASWEGSRKYLEGLRSSDLDRRSKATRSAVRWLLGWPYNS
jgi:hypothetical protein